MGLSIVPLELKEANAVVAAWHRHHYPTVGHKFSLGVVKDGRIVGACIVGRPVARHRNQRTTLEVLRLVTDGTKNACSILYAAAARAGQAMGYAHIQTYILETEEGASLRAAGWERTHRTPGAQWVHTAGPRREDQPTCDKWRYDKVLGGSETTDHLATVPESVDSHPDLFREAVSEEA